MSPPAHPYEDLLAAVFEAHERGDAAAIDHILAAHPLHADRLRAARARLMRSGLLAADSSGGGQPEALGEFRLLQRIGGGGMGVVFLAEQTSLRRKVAVKRIRPELMLSPIARERFQREVATVAQLQHPGIVPVLAVGQHQDVPYFAMEYIAGCSLDEVLLSVARHPPQDLDGTDFARAVGAPDQAGTHQTWCSGTWWQTCVRTLAAVAETVAFVHARGILHRDLKPSNVMVTPEGHALLLDFGLAHSPDGDRLTRSGSELGSLPYMSPEQLRGEALDERTDVYSLGVTLYQMLGLALPFAAEGDAALRSAILTGRTTPLVQRCPGLARDLQIVVATAIDIDRTRRYASMAAMAQDLQALLAHRPIAARPVSLRVRIDRWRHRHPFAAGALMACLLIVVAVPLPIAAREHSRNGELEAARRDALADLGEARKAIDLLVEQADQITATRDPEVMALRSGLLARVLTFYDELANRHPDDAEVLRMLATTHAAIADDGWHAGDLGLAHAHLDAARLAAARAPEPGSKEGRLLVALLDGIAGRLALEAGDVPSADAFYSRRVAALEALAVEEPASRDVRSLLADARDGLSNVRGCQGNGAEKLRLQRQAVAEFRTLLAADPTPKERIGFARLCNNLGEMLAGQPDGLTEAMTCLRDAIAALLDVPPHLRGRADVRTLASEIHIALGAVESRGGDAAAALASFAEAQARLDELAAADPGSVTHQYNRMRVALELGRHHLRRGDHAAAAAAALAAEAIADRAMQQAPGTVSLLAMRRDAEDLRREATQDR